MKRLALKLPLAIGEQIYARASLDAVKHEYDEILVSLNWEQLNLRAPGYRGFAEGFASRLFSEPPYRFDPSANPPYTTFEDLHKRGIRVRLPWFPDILPAPETPIPKQPYVTLNTKVRFLGRPTLEAVTPRIFRELKVLADRYRILLLGERVLCRTGEYEHWGPEAIYSAHDHFSQGVPVSDRTFCSFDTEGFSLARLRRDCALMRNARCNLLLGIGGPLALALSVGKVLAFHHCTCFPYVNDLFALAQQGRAVVTTDLDNFITRLRAL
jgi:hypothetical protein